MKQLSLAECKGLELTSATVTCVIPVYNVGQYLDRCMLSVLGQSRPFDEVILVDDGSTDGSGALCDRYARDFSCVKVIHQVNAGLSAARNTGIEAATGDYLAFVDSDDWITLEYLATLLTGAVATHADMVMGQHIRARSLEEFETLMASNDSTSGFCSVYSQDEFMKIFMRYDGNRAVHYAWGKLYRRDVIEKNHFPVGLLNEDVEGCFKALLNVNSVAEVNRCVYCYFINENSITGKGVGKNYLNLREVWERVADIARERMPEVLPMAEYNVRRTDFTMLCDLVVHGNAQTDLQTAATRRLLQARLRSNLAALYRGPMPLPRKVLAALLAYCYVPTACGLRCMKIGMS